MLKYLYTTSLTPSSHSFISKVRPVTPAESFLIALSFLLFFNEITCTKLSTSRYNKYIFIHKQNISLEVKISDEPVCSSFGWLVRSDGRFVCRSVFHNSLPCSHLITCYFHTLYNKTTQLLS